MPKNDSIYEHWRRAREAYNPLRSLTISRVVTLLEEQQLGIHSNYQWLCRFVERRFPILSALIEKRTSPLQEMEWRISTIDESPVAKAQADLLRSQYEAIDDLYENIMFLAMASFRGFAHIEKIFNSEGQLVELRRVDPWNVVQDGIAERWRYNPGAVDFEYGHFDSEDDMNRDKFIIHTNSRPINEIAVEQFVRFKFSEKDWDAFLDIYGIPSGVVVLGPEADPNDPNFLAMADAVASGGSGTLPNGSTYASNSQPRGEKNPFSERLEFIEKQIVLAGTGGMLTMLTESGSGTLAGGAHSDTFNAIAAKDARLISEVFQKQLDKPLILERFPNQPVLAYFELNFREENDTNEIVEHASKLAAAGYRVNRDHLEERTGYEFEDQSEGAEASADGNSRTASTKIQEEEEAGDKSLTAKNRAGYDSDPVAMKAFAETLGISDRWLRPLREMVLVLEQKANDKTISDEDFAKFLEAAQIKLPELFEDMDIDTLAESFEAAMGSAMVNGAAKSKLVTQ